MNISDSNRERESYKKRLEGELYRGTKKIPQPLWDYLIREEVLAEYESGPLEDDKEDANWAAFKRIAEEKIESVMALVDGLSGLKNANVSNYESNDSINEVGGSYVDYDEFESASDATLARAEALNVQDQMLADNHDIPFRPAASAASFASGWSLTEHPQWIVVIQSPAWVSAEVVKDLYRSVQAKLSNEPSTSKTQEQTLRMVSFVWEQTRDNANKRPPWKLLMQKWNDEKARGDEEEYHDHRSFRRTVVAGEEAAKTKYKASDDEFARLLDSGRQLRAFDGWAARFRESL